jgi:YD repeat-containing protein
VSRIVPNMLKSCLILAVLVLFGCAAPRKEPLTGLVPGRSAETIQTPISLTVKSADRSIGGRGFLIFKSPDRFHIVVFSPFGLTLADIYSDGERLSLVIPARQTAYSGLISELPDRGGLKAWAMMRWVAERTPVAGPSLVRDNVNRSGVREQLYYDDLGLLIRKETEEGDRVVYRDYRNVNGVAVPESIEMSNRRGDTVRIVFEEPEVNQPVEEKVLQPNLEGVTVLPFSEFKGF